MTPKRSSITHCRSTWRQRTTPALVRPSSKSLFRNSIATSDAPDEDEGGCCVEEGGCGCDGGLSVFPQAMVAADPGDEALDHPSFELDGEADLIGLAADDLHGNERCVGDAWSLLSRISKNLFDKWKRTARGIDHRRSTVVILHAGRVGKQFERATVGVDQSVSFAAHDLLTGIVAPRAAAFVGLDRLTVDAGGAG